MRNHIDFSLNPEELFLDPVSDPGLCLLGPPSFLWQTHDPALIEAFAISGHESMRIRTERFLRQTRQHKTFRKVIEFPSLPVVLTGASFRKSHVLVGGKGVLNGASGFRLLNRYCWANERGSEDPEDRLVRYFHARQQANRDARLPVWSGPFPDDLDFAIECRNTFNYFHFLTETLCQLCVLDDLPFRGRVFIHFPNAAEKTRSFTRSFVTALFPELTGRVFLERAPKEYDRVLSSYNLINSFYHLSAEVMGGVDAFAASDQVWKGARATRSSHAVLSMNSMDSSLIRLRARALAAIEGLDFSHLPKRFYVGRRIDQSRRRDLAGEDGLVDLLSAFGFSRIAFEDFTPLEQIALMAQAEVMVAAHGAGFTNMLFAPPEALLIEIGTLQTALYRWGDFWPLANVAGCRYVCFFADYNKDDALTDPRFARDGIVAPALSDYGLGQLMAFVAASLGHPPRLSKAEDVAQLAHRLLRTGQPEAAGALLDRHSEKGLFSVDLCLARADLFKARGEGNGELLALMAAWEADTSRWQTLVQIIWCAKKMDNLKVQGWAVQLLADHFPDRCAEVVKDRPWLRALI